MELDEATEEQIDALAEEGNALLDGAGDWAGAIAVWEKALNLLPDPKGDWPQAVWLYASIGTAWNEAGNSDRAFAAFDAAYRAEDGHVNPYVLVNLGTLLRERDESAAVQILLRAYMLEGEELFVEGFEDDLAFLSGRVDLSKKDSP